MRKTAKHESTRWGAAALTPLALAAGVLLAVPAAQAVPLGDLALDYGNAASINPNGVWSYGWEQSLNAAFYLYDTPTGTQWYASAHRSGDYTPSVWKNTGSSYAYGVGPGEVSLHPGWDGSFSVVRWTSPVAGEVTVEGHFGAGDMGWMSYYVAVNQQTAQQWLTAPGTEAYAFTTQVAVGDTIDFIVGVPIGGGYGFGNTPVAALVSGVPELGSWSLALAGLAVVGGVAWRRRQRPVF